MYAAGLTSVLAVIQALSGAEFKGEENRQVAKTPWGRELLDGVSAPKGNGRRGGGGGSEGKD